LILTGVFASSDVALMDGTINSGGGIINGNWIQVGYQAAAAVVVTVWCFFITYLLAFVFSKIPALSLRCNVEDELKGLDYVQLGEKAYELVSNAVLGLEEDHEVSRISVVNLKAVADGSLDGKVYPVAIDKVYPVAIDDQSKEMEIEAENIPEKKIFTATKKPKAIRVDRN
jgi:Ammonium Transporter Family